MSRRVNKRVSRKRFIKSTLKKRFSNYTRGKMVRPLFAKPLVTPLRAAMLSAFTAAMVPATTLAADLIIAPSSVYDTQEDTSVPLNLSLDPGVLNGGTTPDLLSTAIGFRIFKQFTKPSLSISIIFCPFLMLILIFLD